MSEGKAELRWGVVQRLEFIEFRLFWEGYVNRIDVMQQFGVSRNQASADLNHYIALAPNNMVYDRSARTYIRGDGFACHFREPDAAHYLSQIRLVADSVMDQEDCWIPVLPPYASAPTPVRGVDPVTLRSVVGAIRRFEAIEVKYQSLSSPEPRWRWIAPHAIAFDGFRWHTRAFCLNDKVFKDFLLSRIISTRSVEASEITEEADEDWQEHVTLEIGPHPELSESQKKVIALDYGMRGGKVEIQVRRALLYYALKRLGVDNNASGRPPQEQQIVLASPIVGMAQGSSIEREG